MCSGKSGRAELLPSDILHALVFKSKNLEKGVQGPERLLEGKELEQGWTSAGVSSAKVTTQMGREDRRRYYLLT